jgi:hypothetical protein
MYSFSTSEISFGLDQMRMSLKKKMMKIRMHFHFRNIDDRKREEFSSNFINREDAQHNHYLYSDFFLVSIDVFSTNMSFTSRRQLIIHV